MQTFLRLLGTLALSGLVSVAQAELMPFPETTVVAQGDEAPKSRAFVLSAVETYRRETAVERQVDVVAQRRWVTYELPITTDLSKVKAHYAQQLAGQILFQCEGRDCGRSNTWANQIFGQALLYGRDQEQTYFAAKMAQELVAVYLIKRGNRRQYAHVEVWRPEVMPDLALEAMDSSQWRVWLGELARTGFAVIPQARPNLDGELNSETLKVLSSLAASLEDSLNQNLQLVCHLYPVLSERSAGRAAEVDLQITESLAAAERCAEDAAAVLAAQGKVVTPRGVGPLAPDQARAQSRLVLVLPNRLSR